jgi:hypothetical protein
MKGRRTSDEKVGVRYMANEIVLDKEIAACSISIEHSRTGREIHDRPVGWDVRRGGAELQRLTGCS